MSDIIEPRDVTRILSDGALVTLPDGSRALPVLLVLHPESTVEAPLRVRLGAIEQTYMIEPVPSVVSATPTPLPPSSPDEEEDAHGPDAQRVPGDEPEPVQHDSEQ